MLERRYCPKSSRKSHSIFIGYAPFKNPEIAIAVYIENVGAGSIIAAPIGTLVIEKFLFGKTSRKKIETSIIVKGDKKDEM